ncbi:MAG: acyl-CoA dehydrogenase family protein [Pseudomonadota bacterium]
MKISPEKQARLDAVHGIGREIAGVHAGDVDKNARFPKETIAALKEMKLLSALVPVDLGGMGMGMVELGSICTALGQYCSASAMVFAMHQIQVACLVRHGLASQTLRAYLVELAAQQRLIGSVTSEVGVGGDTRSSICAVERKDGRFILNKDATTISYGEYSDDLLVTCRRGPESPSSDQVMVLLRKGDFQLERTSVWDTLGMRGTCSPGFKLTSSGPEGQIVPGDYGAASSQTMVPFSHILWASLWMGIATDAVARTGSFVRTQARAKPGTVPPTALRLAELSNMLQVLRISTHDVAAECEELMSSPDGNEAMLEIGFSLKMNNVKIYSSEQAVAIIHTALLICGISGYKNDSKYSLGRHLRDAHSAALMVGNDRIYAKNASMLLVHKEP